MNLPSDPRNAMQRTPFRGVLTDLSRWVDLGEVAGRFWESLVFREVGDPETGFERTELWQRYIEGEMRWAYKVPFPGLCAMLGRIFVLAVDGGPMLRIVVTRIGRDEDGPLAWFDSVGEPLPIES